MTLNQFMMATGCTLLGWLLVSGTVWVVLLNTDLIVEGDVLLTHDTDTGLEWLDLRVIQGVFCGNIEAGVAGCLLTDSGTRPRLKSAIFPGSSA